LKKQKEYYIFVLNQKTLNNMNSKLLLIVAGILAIVSAWLPWVSFMGITANGFQGSMGGNPGLFFVILGALIAVMGLIGKKWSAIAAIVLALCVAGLGVKYYMDAGEAVGYGLYVMMAAGVLGIIGGVLAMKGPKSTAA
jgi:hypothetical protein